MRHLYAATSDGHFVDRSVGKITDLEKGDQVADAVATAIEFFAVLGVFAIPIFMLFGALRNRKVTTIAGGWWHLPAFFGIAASATGTNDRTRS